jgi:predicted DNA-binding transcriptional regulator YafY
MADLKRLERALRILQRLMTHDHVTAKELGDLFGGTESVRTIQRTLEAIESANIPLSIEIGAHGERQYSLHRAFDFLPITLSPHEVLAAVLLSQFADYFKGTSIGNDISTVFQKIDQLVPPGGLGVSSSFRDMQDSFMLHEPGRMNLAPRAKVLEDLFRGIIEHRVCKVVYSRTGKSFDIHPYSLLFHGGAFYAVVYQPRHNNWIYLAIARIESLSLKTDEFERDKRFRLREFVRDNFGILSEPPETVRIRFDKTVVASIMDRVWHPSQTIENCDDGGIILTMQVGVTSELLAWILRWQHFAEVLEPQSLRDKLQISLTKTAEIYRSRSPIDALKDKFLS